MSETNIGPAVPQQKGPPSSAPTGQHAAPAASRRTGPEPTGWVGWIWFASVMMIMLGSFHVIDGLVGLFQHDYYLVGQNQLVVHVNYTAWGWLHIIVGAVVIGAGAALLAGRMWARVVGVLVALGSAIVNIAFLSAYPVWSTIMIALDVLVIWALTVHGAEMKTVHDEEQMYG